VSRIEQNGRSSLRRPKFPTKGGSAPKEEEEKKEWMNDYQNPQRFHTLRQCIGKNVPTLWKSLFPLLCYFLYTDSHNCCRKLNITKCRKTGLISFNKNEVIRGSTSNSRICRWGYQSFKATGREVTVLRNSHITNKFWRRYILIRDVTSSQLLCKWWKSFAIWHRVDWWTFTDVFGKVATSVFKKVLWIFWT